MDFKDVLNALRAAWLVVVMGAVVGAAAGFGVTYLMTPLYTSSTQFFVTTRDSQSPADAWQGGQFSQQRVTSYAQLVTSYELLGRVIDQLRLDMTRDELAQEITARGVTETVLLDVSVTDPSPRRAQSIARAIDDQFTVLVKELETPDGSALSPVKVSLLQEPELATSPSAPNVPLNIVLGAVVGLLLAGAVALLRVHLDRSVRDPDDAAAVAGTPVIGTVPEDSVLAKRHVIEWERGGQAAEGYRQLRMNLQFLNVDEPPRVIMVSSALPAEGKTTLAINLALALTESGRRVTVVEADLRRPRITSYLGLVGGVGLTNVLSGTAALDDVIQFYDERGLRVLPAGPIPPNPGELLTSDTMAAVLGKLRATNDFVIVDAPPLLPVADATGLGPLVDGVLLCIRYGRTRKDQVRHASAALDRVRARKLGLVLNLVPTRAMSGGGYGYGYGYASDPPLVSSQQP
ncbi:MAG: capsular exopolysaccharide family [Frankiales bacterium]|nr:capsular exopolysaccharide family [Frankiales bacterium]